jgi:hypothetical protein
VKAGKPSTSIKQREPPSGHFVVAGDDRRVTLFEVATRAQASADTLDTKATTQFLNAIGWCCDQGKAYASTRRQLETIMKKLFSIVPIAAVMLSGAAAFAAELPTYEIAGFPISPHQFVAVPSAAVQERAPVATLTLDGMPASPHQIMVLTPRPRMGEEATARNLTQAGLPSQQPN